MEEDLRFSLREDCALAGVSHQSIRMYEKWDVLPKIAQEGNGYRYYHYPDLQRVIFLRYYASLGVPIKASAALINGASTKELQSVMKNYEQELQKKILFEQAALECVRRQTAFLEEINDCRERCWVEYRPAMYRLRCSDEGRMSNDPEAVRLMKEWAGLFPVVLFSGVSETDDMDRPDQLVSPGYAIYAEHAALLSGTESPYIDYYPSVRSVRAILRIGSQARDFCSMGEFVLRFIRQKGLRPCGQIVSVSIANKALTSACAGDPSDYVCCWTPIE